MHFKFISKGMFETEVDRIVIFLCIFPSGFHASDDEYDYYSSMEDRAGISCSNRVCASFK